MTRWVIVADDLTGSCDAAAPFAAYGGVAIALTPEAPWPAADVVAVDTDSRYAPPGVAGRRVGLAVERATAAGARVFKKIDSLLRGNVAVEVAAAARALGGPERPALAVVAPAFPATGRTLRGGVVHVAGRPLAERHGGDLRALLAEAGLTADLVPADGADPAARFAHAYGAGVDAVVCDGETDADLTAVVAAAARARRPLFLVGTGGLAHAVSRAAAGPGTGPAGSGPVPGAPYPASATRGDARAAPAATAVSGGSRPWPAGGPGAGSSPAARTGACGEAGPALAVIGSYAGEARAQRAALVAAGWTPVTLPVTGPGMRRALAGGRVVLSPDPAAPVDRAAAARVARDLAAATATVADDLAALAVTGGETAHAVLNRLGVTEITVIGELEPGVVAGRLPGRRTRFVTKAGAFGDAGTLVRVLGAGPAAIEQGEKTMGRPVIGITMGDAAGIGPEIIVRALADPAVYGRSRPLVIGAAARLRRAAEITGSGVRIRAVEGPEQAGYTAGVIDCVDLDVIPDDLPFGELSAVAGEGAYRFIERAVSLAVGGRIDAICTAPLNKEALHAAGHRYPGHTELLAELTGTPEVSMMLTTPKLKVIHVTTHIGLVDAVAKIDDGLVERTIRRGHDTLVKAGLTAPAIAVCGINPHAGEHGLFGRGEEEEKIVPAIERLRADGIDAQGPLPADTVFFRAVRGDYDLVVAMYHDQGHGPVKVMGLDEGVNITVGLPVIRTSVDHGTAFDIAGTGRADHASMLEAIRQAVELAPSAAEPEGVPSASSTPSSAKSSAESSAGQNRRL